MDQDTHQCPFITFGTSYVAMGLETGLFFVVLYYLSKLLRKTFSYKKNGLYEAIEIHVVALFSLIIIILSRGFQIDTKPQSANKKHNQQYSSTVFGSLLDCMCVLFVNDIYLFLSIIWLRFALEAEMLQRYKSFRKWIKILGPYVFNLAAAIAISYLHICQSQQSRQQQQKKPSFLKLSMIALIFSTFFTQFVFTYSTIKIVIQSRKKKVKDFQDKSKALSIVAIILLVCSYIRIVLFILQIVLDPAVMRGYDYDNCEDKNYIWGIMILVDSILFIIFPIVVILVFLKIKFQGVKNPQRAHNLFQSTLLQW